MRRNTMDLGDIIRVTSAAEVFVDRLTAADREEESIRELQASIARVLDAVASCDCVYILGHAPLAQPSRN